MFIATYDDDDDNYAFNCEYVHVVVIRTMNFRARCFT